MKNDIQGFYARRWHDAVKAKMDSGQSRRQAILAVERENPGLRSRFLQEVNSNKAKSRGRVW